MNRSEQKLEQKPLPKPPFPPEDYHLEIRQGPNRAKVPSPREKALVLDRKPIDPQPILQLKISEEQDPQKNYLQSPYHFMWCSLLPGDEYSSEAIPQNILSGGLVSSLHRLKDVDNTDGAFFVFGDLSVTMRGRYRLRFSLYEMVKTHVVFITSIDSDPFTAYTHKEFPGMLESTFLARSFGDQGVRLKTRKESRTMLKRPPPSKLHSEPDGGMTPGYPHQSFVNQQTPQSQYRFEPNSDPRRTATLEHHEPAAKRQRTTTGIESHEQEPRFPPRLFTDVRPPNTYSSAYQNPSGQVYRYPGEPYSAPSTVSDYYQFGHQRTNSSTASSPYVSPQTDFTFSSISSSNYQMQHSREPSHHQSHPADAHQQKHVPYPTPPKQHDQPLYREPTASASHSAAEVLANMSYAAPVSAATRTAEDSSAFASKILSPAPISGRPILPPLQAMMPAIPQSSAPHLRSSNVLPPIESSLTREIDSRHHTQQQYQRHHPAAPPIGTSST